MEIEKHGEKDRNIDSRRKNRGQPSHVGLDQNTKRFVIYVSVSVASIIALSVIFVVALMPVFKAGFSIPSTLENWGGLIIGFYFGTLVSLLKDWSRESVEVYRSDDP